MSSASLLRVIVRLNWGYTSGQLQINSMKLISG